MKIMRHQKIFESLDFRTLINYRLLLSVVSGHMTFWEEPFSYTKECVCLPGCNIAPRMCMCESQCVCVYTPHPCQFSVFAAISEVMTGNHQQGDLNKQPQWERYSKFSACSTGALHFPPSHCWYNRWVEWGHIMNGAACPELCANLMSEP